MLYVVATPIGNLGDLSARALEILSACDLIAAEDTRRTQKLLTHFQIRKPLISYYEHNKASRGRCFWKSCAAARQSRSFPMRARPGISDPGADLIRAAVAEGLPVSMAPVPSPALWRSSFPDCPRSALSSRALSVRIVKAAKNLRK